MRSDRPGWSNRKESERKPCPKCGIQVHRFGTCPAIGKACLACGKEGHFAKMCSARVNAVKNATAENKSEDSEDKVKIYE